MSTTYENHIKATDRLYEESLKSFVSYSQLHTYIKSICDEYDELWRSENIFEINGWDFSKPHLIFRVNERIRLARSIFPNDESTFDDKYSIPPLSEYLLLTCIDQLGQPQEWLTFDSWLQSKRKKSERNQIIDVIDSLDNVDFSLKLYNGYQKLYGVKNSFFQFFNEYLKEPYKSNFFSKMKIEIYNKYPENFNWKAGSEEDKMKYLFALRNNFTHRTKPTGPYELLFPWNKDESGWYEKEMIYGKNITQKIRVISGYYEELELIIKVGLWEFIKKHQKC